MRRGFRSYGANIVLCSLHLSDLLHFCFLRFLSSYLIILYIISPVNSTILRAKMNSFRIGDHLIIELPIPMIYNLFILQLKMMTSGKFYKRCFVADIEPIKVNSKDEFLCVVCEIQFKNFSLCEKDLVAMCIVNFFTIGINNNS